MDPATTEKLMAELRAVARDVDALIRTAAAASGEQLNDAGGSAREAASEIDNLVRTNPWAAVGIAAGVALLLGLLLSRK
ncbi:MAG TPA: hypothetical protein VH881_10105 [Burkholderiales bacterium]|jgi:ElaB/YqjD/DUF883 family membrane-anchored ribosome-binding protein